MQDERQGGKKTSERRPGLENYMEVKRSIDTVLDSDAHGESRWEDDLKQIGALLDQAKVFDLNGDLKDLLTNTENEMEITFPLSPFAAPDLLEEFGLSFLKKGPKGRGG